MKPNSPGPRIRSVLIGGALLWNLAGCMTAVSGPDYQEDESSPTPAPGGSAARAFPVGLAVASPFASAQATASSEAPHRVAPVAQLSNDSNYSAKSTTVSEVLNGTTLQECLVAINLNNAGFASSSCFGPSIAYKNHPEDPDASDEEQASGGGDSGIWLATDEGTGEACVAAQINMTVQAISNQVDSGTLIAASMLCVANVTGATLPDQDQSLDLTAAMQEAYSAETSFAVVTATLARENDTADGFPVYVSSLDLDSVDFDGAPQAAELRLKHIPLDADNTTYQGKLSMAVRTDNGRQEGNCGEAGDGTVAGKTSAFSIAYSRDAQGFLQYRLDSSEFCGVEANPFVSAADYSVDVNNVLSAGNAYGHDGYFIARAGIQSSTGAGDYQFARQMGANDANTRTLSAHLETQDGSMVGRGYFGYGPSIYEERVGEIDGMSCNWGLPSSSGTSFVDFAQAQYVVYDAISDRFLPAEDGNHFAYAPMSTCSYVVPDGETSDFRFWAKDLEAEEQARGASSVTHALLGIDEIDVAVPTDPADVDAG